MLPLKSPPKALVASACEQPECVLVDGQDSAGLPESLAGYQSALETEGARFLRTSAVPLPHAKTIIVPACLVPCPALTQEIAVALEGGSCVVLESGAGFATRQEFAAHQEWLRNHCSVRVEAPVDLWRPLNEPPGQPRSRGRLTIRNSPLPRGAPYVDFHWPFRTKIRDFTRMVPVSALPEQVVASCRDWPVASKHDRGRGTLVFLGSPIGPALLAGDAEAHRWLRALITV
jgi:hypothetical protein